MLSNHHKGTGTFVVVLMGDCWRIGAKDRLVALMRVRSSRGVPRATCRFFDYGCLPWHTSLEPGATRFGYLVPVLIRPYF